MLVSCIVHGYIIKIQSVALRSHGQPILNGYLEVHRQTISITAMGSVFHYVTTLIEESVSTAGPLQQDLTVQVS